MNNCIFSEDRKYRYVLEHKTKIDNNKRLLWILLNPSTADEQKLDPTLTRCKNFTEKWEFGVMIVCNLFAFRSKSPKEMMEQKEYAIGFNVNKDNDWYIINEAQKADLVIVGWGNHGKFLDRCYEVEELLTNIPKFYFGLTKNEQPRHPLYLSKNAELYYAGGDRNKPKCTLFEYNKTEYHHFMCACGDCACHGWDGGHYGLEHHCLCHIYINGRWEKESNK